MDFSSGSTEDGDKPGNVGTSDHNRQTAWTAAYRQNRATGLEYCKGPDVPSPTAKLSMLKSLTPRGWY